MSTLPQLCPLALVRRRLSSCVHVYESVCTCVQGIGWDKPCS